MKKLFGTNGVRGVFSEDFTLEFVNDLVMSLAAYFKQGKFWLDMMAGILVQLLQKLFLQR